MKELSGDYREITKHLVKMESHLRTTYEVQESHSKTIGVVHRFLSEMKGGLEKVMGGGGGGEGGTIDRLMSRIVEGVY